MAGDLSLVCYTVERHVAKLTSMCSFMLSVLVCSGGKPHMTLEHIPAARTCI